MSKPCEYCDGKGTYMVMSVADNMDMDEVVCDECGGTGEVRDES